MTILKSAALAAALLGLPAAASAQSLGYSVSDLNQANPNGGLLYSFDLQTGVATELGLIEYEANNEIEGIGSLDGRLVGVSEGDGIPGVAVDLLPPPGATITSIEPREGAEAGAAYDPTSGTLFNIQAEEAIPQSWLYSIDLTGGAPTLIGTNSIFADGLAINAQGQAFASDFRITDSLYSVDLETGLLSLIGGFGLDLDVNEDSGLAFDELGQLFGITEDGSIYSIDTGTGAATFTAFIQDAEGNRLAGDFEGFEILPQQEVPAPAALALFGLGAAGVGFARHRGAKRTRA